MKSLLTTIIVVIFSIMPCNAELEKVLLVDHNEFRVEACDVLQIPFQGLGIRCNQDSVMMLDSPTLSSVHWKEPNMARSIISCGTDLYAAEGDSIYRLGTDKAPHKFIGRFDNESFTLYPASTSHFYVCTADENYSSILKVQPSTGECEMFFDIEGPVLKVCSMDNSTMVWVDDCIFQLTHDRKVIPVFADDSITDIALTPMGVMVATNEGIVWLQGPESSTMFVKGNVTNLWWDDKDALYYRTIQGDIIALYDILETFLSLGGK